MIARIDKQADIDIYLHEFEVQELGRRTIEGTIVRSWIPKQQGTLSISVNDARQDENGSGIGIDDTVYDDVKDGFEIEVFVGSHWYQQLLEHGRVGLRHRMRDGSKVTVYNRTRLDRTEEHTVSTLEFYVENKVQLPERFR
ncbi:hypothetical protein KY362_06105 [Candidatus Woesearchaeota archaeon]|nr:hypothetical protein [Candidatus Woesearchaeota archaeon]